MLDTFCVVTTSPNEMMARIHDRMPVILDFSDYDLWLETTRYDPALLKRLFQPHDPSTLEAYPVGKRVNNFRNDEPALIEPAKPDLPGLFDEC